MTGTQQNLQQIIYFVELSLSKIYFKFMYVCMYACTHVCRGEKGEPMSAGALGGQKWVLEFQVVVSYLRWVLGTELTYIIGKSNMC